MKSDIPYKRASDEIRAYVDADIIATVLRECGSGQNDIEVCVNEPVVPYPGDCESVDNLPVLL